MGSALVLRGGMAAVKTVKERISITNTFAIGDVIRFDVATMQWVKAQANSASNAEVAGVVSYAAGNEFDITYGGYIQLPTFTDPILFLSSETAGLLTPDPPSTVGTVVKPILTKTDAGYVVTNYLGTQIGGESTVTIEEVQPVGTIMPFAGSGTVPDTWLECNGASYGVSEYSELYDKLLHSGGDRPPMYGSVVRITCTSNLGLSIGDYVLFKSNASTSWTSSPTANFWNDVALADVVGRVVSTTSTTITVQVEPKFSNGKFSVSNVQFGTGQGSGTAPGNSARSYRFWGLNNNVPNLTVNASSWSASAVEVTHFNTPDLRGRFSIGVNPTAVAEGSNENSTTFNSALGVYNLAEEGGEETHTLTTAEMPAHTHAVNSAFFGIDGSGRTTLTNANTGTGLSSTIVGTEGANAPHNNVPPYLALRYIIKAKPYTRAAVIDGVDPDYANLLITDLRSGVMRGAGNGEDLVFKTNTSVSTSGTERMRLRNSGSLLIGAELDGTFSSTTPKLHVYDRVNRVPDTITVTDSSNFAVSGGDPVNGAYTAYTALGSDAMRWGHNSYDRHLHIGTATSTSLIYPFTVRSPNSGGLGRIGIGVSLANSPDSINGTLTVQGKEGSGVPTLLVEEDRVHTSPGNAFGTLQNLWTNSTARFKCGLQGEATRLLVSGITSGTQLWTLTATNPGGLALQSSNANGVGPLGMAVQPFGGDLLLGGVTTSYMSEIRGNTIVLRGGVGGIDITTTGAVPGNISLGDNGCVVKVRGDCQIGNEKADIIDVKGTLAHRGCTFAEPVGAGPLMHTVRAWAVIGLQSIANTSAGNLTQGVNQSSGFKGIYTATATRLRLALNGTLRSSAENLVFCQIYNTGAAAANTTNNQRTVNVYTQDTLTNGDHVIDLQVCDGSGTPITFSNAGASEGIMVMVL